MHRTPTIPEQDAIAAAQRGDIRAFEHLVSSYQDAAFSVAYHILGSRDAAMDATQDAFIRAFEGLARYRGGSFKSWILRITTNCSYDQLRYKQRRPSTPIDDLVEDDEHSSMLMAEDEEPEEYAERSELNGVIRRGLRTLPKDQRAVLVLADIEGLSYNEIAETLDASVGTIKSRLSRARAKLRDFMLEREELLPSRLRLGVGDTKD
ncbi:MAG: sigma-70 family RNA polymerase sigma factor [Chloroflexi bacterium]|nr:sigma-70 family RNA polymerase sigma factor [Chloroflexota bacterium]